MKLDVVGKVLGLFISKNDTSKRVSIDSIVVDQKGVRLDKFYNKNIQRSVLIASTESYQLAQKKEINMEYGLLGENILVNFNPYTLDAGIQLKVGAAILEISQHCTICDHLSAIDPILPQLLAQNRGIFAKVIQEGKINKRDNIYLIKEN